MSELSAYGPISGERFIETGTRDGNSLWYAKDHFKKCLSVELDRDLFARAIRRFHGVNDVELYMDYSYRFLRYVIDHRIPTTFWLDAHWDGNPILSSLHTEGIKQCPLLEELYEIERINWRTPPIILIDDMRMFNGEDFRKHPGRWKEDEWPTIEQIDAALPGYTREIVGTDIDPILRYTR